MDAQLKSWMLMYLQAQRPEAYQEAQEWAQETLQHLHALDKENFLTSVRRHPAIRLLVQQMAGD